MAQLSKPITDYPASSKTYAYFECIIDTLPAPTWADLRFTDILGREHHMTVPFATIDDDFFTGGKVFDASSFKGWKQIDDSDMILRPANCPPVVDPFNPATTVVVRCEVYERNGTGYDLCPRVIAERAEQFLRDHNLADTVFVGPELEFFIFSDVRYQTSINHSFYALDDEEGAWNSATKFEHGNSGHRPAQKSAYAPLAPLDQQQDLRSAMCEALSFMGIQVEAHHHEVATCQNEIATRFNTLTRKADEVQNYKYAVREAANQYGKSVTFMPKPLFGDNGSGMHVHFSLGKDGQNLFVGDEYGGLSETALYFLGGILKHANALNAFTNPSTNSYKRLVPGYEAPVILAYSSSNRSAAIRIPAVSTPKAKRVEIRFPDCTANPYLAFAALLMAGVDGIVNKIHPGPAIDKNLYKLPKEELRAIPHVCDSLDHALDALEADFDFLLRGNVFPKELIWNYVNLKRKEARAVNLIPNPKEFELYYSC